MNFELPYWDEIFEELFPDACPREISLEHAQRILGHLYNTRLLAPTIGTGECSDCQRERVLIMYGRLEVCWPCAFKRRHVATMLEAA